MPRADRRGLRRIAGINAGLKTLNKEQFESPGKETAQEASGG
jgi:hypothetical protein